jgi:hypothetical protein
MDLLEYKYLLKKKGIKLFDYEYRLSLYKINLLNSFNNDQIGGGAKILLNKNNYEVKNIIDCCLSNNIKLGYIYNLIYN